jgi:hypothetical protein
MLAYRNTSGRKFTVSGKLVSRNVQEANQNVLYINLIRSWILPDFGDSGATPPILRFFAYNNSNINNVETVMRSYSISFPDDIDYIFQDSSGTAIDPLPVVMLINIDLDEVYSAEEITNKNWKINLVGGGSFVPGGSEASGGGTWTERKSTVPSLSNTPDISDLTRMDKFTGIASNNMIPTRITPFIQDPLSIIRNPTMLLAPASNFISEQVRQIAPIINSPFINSGVGISQLQQAQRAQQTYQNINQLQQNQNLNQFNRYGQQTIKIPIEIF